MENEKVNLEETVGEMHKRRETMADGKRYIIYYTFGDEANIAANGGDAKMSELRWNPLLGEWTVTATHRQDRTFFPPPGYCPLCPTAPGGFPTEIPEADL